jgi:hypothetical protein
MKVLCYIFLSTGPKLCRHDNDRCGGRTADTHFAMGKQLTFRKVYPSGKVDERLYVTP